MQYRWNKLRISNSCLLIELYTLCSYLHPASRNVTSIYTREEGETNLCSKPQNTVPNESTHWNWFSWPYQWIVTKLTMSNISDKQGKNTPTSNWLINTTVKNTLISLIKCTARFLSAKIRVTSVNDTVNMKADAKHVRCDLFPCQNPIIMIFKQLSSQVHNKRLTLSFGFAIQHVLLSLLGCNIIVQAVEKILLIVYFLAAVTRNNRQEGMSSNN